MFSRKPSSAPLTAVRSLHHGSRICIDAKSLIASAAISKATSLPSHITELRSGSYLVPPHCCGDGRF